MADTLRVSEIRNLIETNLSSSKDPKISPADHRPISLGIIDYIDNRVLTGNNGVVFGGSVTLPLAWPYADYYAGYGTPDGKVPVVFGTQVATPNYTVIGCLTATVLGDYNSRYFWMVSERTTTSFQLLLRAKYIMRPAPSLTFEFILFSNDEL